MKIFALRSENVKRLRVISIRPDGKPVVVVRGDNAQGKSSVLDSIAYALGGARLCPTVPVRRGAERAVVKVDLGDLVVERQWDEHGKSTLSVKSAEGARIPSPQAVLDKLIGELCFDPLAFLRERPADQAAILGRALGLDFRDHDAKRAALFEERTNVNRDAKVLRGALARMPEVGDAPDEYVSLAELVHEHEEALRGLNAVDDAKRVAKEATEKRKGAEIELSRAEAAVKDFEAKLAKARDAVVQWKAALERYRKAEERQADAVGRVVLPDLEGIRQRIAEVEKTNERVRAKKARAVEAAKLEAKENESARLTDELARLDAEKAKKIADARFPIEGLAFSPDGVTLLGLPFSQASQAEQLKVSLGVGLALNAELRVVLIRDGSLLDEKSLRVVAEMAEKHDAQVWIEVVGKGGSGIVIEDGAVEAERPLRLVEGAS